MERASNLFQNRYITDEERETLCRVETFCEESAIEFEVVDVGTLGFLKKLESGIVGLKTPTVSCGKKMFHGVPSEKDLDELCKR